MYDRIIKKTASCFKFNGSVQSVQPFGNGHINDTFLVTCAENDKERHFILQRINRQVFKDPDELMKNIVRVTEHIEKKLRLQGAADIDRKVLKVIYTKENKQYFQDNEDHYWRACAFINNGCTYDKIRSPVFAYRGARQFGLFSKMLADLPRPRLNYTIRDFHNGPKRLQQFKEVLEQDPCGRAKDVEREVDFILEHEAMLNVLPSLVEQGEIPLRPTHNDAKINNVVFDADTHKALCVIDLDTVMPGITLFDFGDLVRTAAATADEDEPDAGKMTMNIDLFYELLRGFGEQTASMLTATEKRYFVLGSQVIILEQAIRFLTDYLAGDLYYKTNHIYHNRDRARTQIALLRSTLVQEDRMKDLVGGFFHFSEAWYMGRYNR